MPIRASGVPMNGGRMAIDLNTIVANTPDRLRERRQWVCWKYIECDGKATKCPVNARTGAPADSTDPSTWVSFDEAIAAYRDRQQYAGVGYVFTAEDPFTGIDLDGCIDDDGDVVGSAREIIDVLNSYTEVSPSGRGVKIFVGGRKPDGLGCRSKTIAGFKETEVYSEKRFFTVTGRHVAGTPLSVEDRQAELESLCRRLWPRKYTPRINGTTNTAVVDLDDEALIERASEAKNGDRFKRLWAGDTSLHGGDHSAADQSLCNALAFWTGCDATRMDWLFRQSGLFRKKWNEKRGDRTYGQITIETAIVDCTDAYSPRSRYGPRERRASESTTTNNPARSAIAPERPNIVINTEEHQVVRETIAALTLDPDLYQRGAMLVRVIRDRQPTDRILRCDGSPTIQPLPAANLRERMTRLATFTKRNRKDEEVAAHPTTWLVSAIEARAEWDGIRDLTGISDTPILRPDGSVWQTAGYDARTGVLFDLGEGKPFPFVDAEVHIDDAKAARDVLLEIVCDFPFESDEHRAAWLAALLTPLARFAFAGPSPLFLIDANVRGAGKGLLAQTVGRIVLGREMPVSSYSHDSEEMRKKITAIAIGGDRMILLDNLEGSFGNDALDRALTSTRWKDRLLGKSQEIELPLIPVWFATGNNVQVAADTMRRIIHIRLDCLTERPEERSGFRRENLLAWIDAKRATLLSAALTILSASLRSGRPVKDLKPFGSFEGWSSVVREAVVRVGQPDPCLTRTKFAESADTNADVLSQLIAAWKRYERSADGVVVSEMLAALYPPHGKSAPSDGASVAMRGAIENLVGCSPGKAPTTRQVGNKLRNLRRRVVGGVYLDSNPNEYNRAGAVWRLCHVEPDD